jgi:hypothetical protein
MAAVDCSIAALAVFYGGPRYPPETTSFTQSPCTALTPTGRFAAHGRSRLQVKLRCHMFRAIGIAAGGTLENAEALATHESPRTTSSTFNCSGLDPKRTVGVNPSISLR